MISKEEAFTLATEGMDKNVTAHLIDFEYVCVIEFGYTPPTHQLRESPSSLEDGEPLAEIPTEPIPMEVPTGLSPVLVDKRNGEIFETGSDVLYPAEDYAACYMATGSPRGTPSASVVVSGPPDACDNLAAIEAIVTASSLGLASAKLKLKEINLKRRPQIETASPEAAAELAQTLQALGVDAMQDWIAESSGREIGRALFEIDDTDITLDIEDHLPPEKK